MILVAGAVQWVRHPWDEHLREAYQSTGLPATVTGDVILHISGMGVPQVGQGFASWTR